MDTPSHIHEQKSDPKCSNEIRYDYTDIILSTKLQNRTLL